MAAKRQAYRQSNLFFATCRASQDEGKGDHNDDEKSFNADRLL